MLKIAAKLHRNENINHWMSQHEITPDIGVHVSKIVTITLTEPQKIKVTK